MFVCQAAFSCFSIKYVNSGYVFTFYDLTTGYSHLFLLRPVFNLAGKLADSAQKSIIKSLRESILGFPEAFNFQANRSYFIAIPASRSQMVKSFKPYKPGAPLLYKSRICSTLSDQYMILRIASSSRADSTFTTSLSFI